MSVLTERLDKVASSLENQGLLHEAEAVDMISNTLEAFEKEAWTAAKSPIYLKFFAPALNAAKAGNAEAALKFLNMGDGMRKALVGDRLQVPEFKFFSGLWDQAVAALSKGDAARAAADLEKAEGFLGKMEPIINSEAPGYMPPQGRAPVQSPGSMVFPAKGVNPGAMPARAPLPHPPKAMAMR
jgi:hypothetical protein